MGKSATYRKRGTSCGPTAPACPDGLFPPSLPGTNDGVHISLELTTAPGQPLAYWMVVWQSADNVTWGTPLNQAVVSDSAFDVDALSADGIFFRSITSENSDGTGCHSDYLFEVIPP